MILVCLLAAPLPAAAQLHIWVDEHGHTHVTDDPDAVPSGEEATESGGLRTLWGDDRLGEPLAPTLAGTSSEADRQLRSLRAALDDLERGETARAAVLLKARAPRSASAHRPCRFSAFRRSSVPAFQACRGCRTR
jgi:hypothetical protein